jgi:hypothetical protein
VKRSGRNLGAIGRTFSSPAKKCSGGKNLRPLAGDKVLNHQTGTTSGVAAVYQRHDFLTERKRALERWGAHVCRIVPEASKLATCQ